MAMLNDATYVVFVAVWALGMLWVLATRRPAGLPPGPGLALPLLGHMHLLGSDPRPKFRQWARQYGDVFSLYFGSRPVVAITGFDTMKEAFVKHGASFSERPRFHAIESMGSANSLFYGRPDVWPEQRKISVELLGSMGMAKKSHAEKIEEEIRYYIQAIHDMQGQPGSLTHLTQTSVSNNICSIILGKRFDYTDHDFVNYVRNVIYIVDNSHGSALLNALPWLDYLPGDLFNMKEMRRRCHAVLIDFFQAQIDQQRRSPTHDHDHSFITAYFKRQEKLRAAGKEITWTDEHLRLLLADLFVAGTDTSATAILYTISFLMHHQDVQERCYQQILSVVGTARPPRIQDRLELPYVEATILESLRAADPEPFLLPHCTLHDVHFRGFLIPKDTMVLANFTQLANDPKLWGDSHNFRPERFLDSSGKKVVKPDQFAAFGVGRRACIGEGLARMELFLYIATIIQRFQILPPGPGKPPPMESVVGTLAAPKPFKVRAIPRE